ncbi:hypothetical protein [Streptomyces bambusae]|uniref:Uncharacterized protein n=1 Tax=Streptomyces bambusae TaxID=1550616 RepID=A0ABS6Z608_9ACTN|nr:hypothetical protein [Streptomyces bambusae]MBW5483205.1 hypothetical protein [Streptomyces bambusae]
MGCQTLRLGCGQSAMSRGGRMSVHGAPEESVSAGYWIDAFCLSVLADRHERHGEAFHFARQKAQRAGSGLPTDELIAGLTAYVLGDLDDDEQDFPPSGADRLAAVEAALVRVGERSAAAEGQPDGLTDGQQAAADLPHTLGLRAVRAHRRRPGRLPHRAGRSAAPGEGARGPGSTARHSASTAPGRAGRAGPPPRGPAGGRRLRLPAVRPGHRLRGRGPRVAEYGRDRRVDAAAAEQVPV